MKTIILLMLCMHIALVDAAKGSGGASSKSALKMDPETMPGETELGSLKDAKKIQMWMSPALLSGYLTFLFLLVISYNAFLFLGAI